MSIPTFKRLKYNRARLSIMRLISESGLVVGDCIPSIRKLVDILPYGSITIRHALSDMVNEGLIESRPGSCNYLRRELKDNRFSADILFLFVGRRHENIPGPAVERLRLHLANLGLGLSVLSVYEFGLNIVEASRNSLGVIASGWLTDSFLKDLSSLLLPTIVVGNLKLSDEVKAVRLNLESGTYQLTKQFIADGFKDIHLLSNSSVYLPSLEYAQGYQRAMNEAGFPLQIIPENNVVLKSPEIMDAYMSKHANAEVVLMEEGAIHDFISWYVRSSRVKFPAIGFLSMPANYRRYRHTPKYRFVHYQKANMIALQQLLNHVISGEELKSVIIEPTPPPLDDKEFFWVN